MIAFGLLLAAVLFVFVCTIPLHKRISDLEKNLHNQVRGPEGPGKLEQEIASLKYRIGKMEHQLGFGVRP